MRAGIFAHFNLTLAIKAKQLAFFAGFAFFAKQADFAAAVVAGRPPSAGLATARYIESVAAVPAAFFLGMPQVRCCAGCDFCVLPFVRVLIFSRSNVVQNFLVQKGDVNIVAKLLCQEP